MSLEIPFRVVGVDIGVRRCGLVDLRDGELVDAAVFATEKEDGTIRDRLEEIENDLAPHTIGAHVIVVESPNFPKGSVAAAMLWAAFGLVRGLARHAAALHVYGSGEWRRELGLPTERQAPGESYAAVERRRKIATERLVLSRYPTASLLLHKVKRAERNHAYDALGLTCAYFDTRAKRPPQTTFQEVLDGTTR